MDLVVGIFDRDLGVSGSGLIAERKKISSAAGIFFCADKKTVGVEKHHSFAVRCVPLGIDERFNRSVAGGEIEFGFVSDLCGSAAPHRNRTGRNKKVASVVEDEGGVIFASGDAGTEEDVVVFGEGKRFGTAQDKAGDFKVRSHIIRIFQRQTVVVEVAPA